MTEGRESTLFISDLHLDSRRPDKLELFQRLLAGPARRADALYVLGDLFEAWLGDDDLRPPHAAALSALRGLSEAGVALYVLHGNRDFLMGSGFAEQTGAVLLPDPGLIDLYGEQVLIMHGDLLCTLDVDYQAFRQQVHNPLWQRQFLAMPLAQRAAIAMQLREGSQQATAHKAESIMDVEPGEVLRVMKDHGVRTLIHGHTHRPAIHALEIDDAPATRIVLGDWYQRDSVLVYTPEERRLLGVEEYLAEAGG